MSDRLNLTEAGHPAADVNAKDYPSIAAAVERFALHSRAPRKVWGTHDQLCHAAMAYVAVAREHPEVDLYSPSWFEVDASGETVAEYELEGLIDGTGPSRRVRYE